jgi:hypothetical protein
MNVALFSMIPGFVTNPMPIVKPDLKSLSTVMVICPAPSRDTTSYLVVKVKIASSAGGR